MAAETEWLRIAFEAGASMVSGLAGLLVGAWKWGRGSAQAEQALKDDYNGKITKLRDEVRATMTSHAQKADEGNDLLVSQFKESFDGIRRQHDEHRIDVEKRFMLKDDFREFREEYREDIRDLKALIAARKQ